MRAAIALAAAGLAAADLQTYTYGSSSSQEQLFPCTPIVQCNEDTCGDVCLDGTVQVDPWLQAALKSQRGLQSNRSLAHVQWVGTHNSFISRANGFGMTEDFATAVFTRTAPVNWTTVRIADQRYGPVDQANLGVRHFEVDIWLADVIFGKVVNLCHFPTQDPSLELALYAEAEKIGVTVPSHNGWHELCSNISMATGVGKLKSWLDSNPEEIIGLFLDNRVPAEDGGYIVSELQGVFGDAIMTPVDVATRWNGTLPSPNAMLAAGKRLYVESNHNFSTNPAFLEVIFNPTTWDAWQFGSGDITPFPNCTIWGRDDWYASGTNIVRALDGSTVWPPWYDERQDGVIDYPNGAADIFACGANVVSMSDFGYRHLAGLVWSWAVGEPRAPPTPGTCTAGAMTLVRGRWTAQPCSREFKALCRKGDPNAPAGHLPDHWALTPEAVSFSGAAAACEALGAGWSFDVPRDGRENAQAASMALFGGIWPGPAPGVWLNQPLTG